MSEKKEDIIKELYYAPAAVAPSFSRLNSIAENLGLDFEEEDLKQHHTFMKKWLENCSKVDCFPQPTLPVKYPRTPGYQPGPEENKYNAWYWKTDIHGASSGKLFGKKIAIKDNIAVAGVPMMNGSALTEGYVAEFDASVVTRILDAGGVIAGKAACEALCFSGNSFTGSKGPILNPHNPEYSAGGSSSGSAVLIASGEVDMALGCDQGGSIRMPSCWTGVVGLKPTFGLVPYTGIQTIEVLADHVGPMAQTVEDCALLLEVLAGYDGGLDPRQKPGMEVKEYTKALCGDLQGVKVGILKEGFEQVNTEADVAKLVRDAAHSLSTVGANVEDVSIPMHIDGHSIWNVICYQGAYENMMRSGGVPVGYMGHYPISMMEHTFRQYKVYLNNMSELMKGATLTGQFLREQYGNKFYSKAVNLIPMLRGKYDEALEKYDVLVFPTISFKATKLPKKGASVSDLLDVGSNMLANTGTFNVTGHPVLNINAGFSEGLPVGMSIAGKHFDECTVLKVAHAFEKIRDSK